MTNYLEINLITLAHQILTCRMNYLNFFPDKILQLTPLKDLKSLLFNLISRGENVKSQDGSPIQTINVIFKQEMGLDPTRVYV